MLSRDQRRFDFAPPTKPPPAESNALDRLQCELRFVAHTVMTILESLPLQRRPLSATTKAVHAEVTWLRRNGLCPCCQQMPVCGPEERLLASEFDHWYGRSRNRPEETWLVCRGCNQLLETPAFKAKRQERFRSLPAGKPTVS
jgi:hypothetical protein